MGWKVSLNCENYHDIYNSLQVEDDNHEWNVFLAKEEDSIGDVVDPDNDDTFERNEGEEYINSSVHATCNPSLRDSLGDSSSKHEFMPCPHCGAKPPQEFMKFVKNPLLLKMGNKL